MKIKDLLRVIFRIFGLYSVLNLIFNFLPAQITYLINAKLFFPFDAESGILQTWIYLAIVLILIIIIFYILILNPEFIIKNLKPKSFLENYLNFEKLNPESLVQIAIISLGILFLFDSIPEFINKLFLWSKINNMNGNTQEFLPSVTIKSEFFISLSKIFLGLIFIIFQNIIGKFLYRQNTHKSSI